MEGFVCQRGMGEKQAFGWAVGRKEERERGEEENNEVPTYLVPLRNRRRSSCGETLSDEVALGARFAPRARLHLTIGAF